MIHRTPASARRRSAFSLVELLVVIGILVVLIAIVAPMVVKARKTAARTRQAADLQTIATALEAFKADHGDYPRPFAAGAGFATLGQALIGPGPASATTTPPNPFNSGEHYEGGEVVDLSGTAYVSIKHNEAGIAPPNADYWAVAPWADFADGPGFRLRPQGQVYGPYLQADRFKLRGYAILDIWGNPILYFPARAGSVNINKPASPGTQAPTYVWDSRDTLYTPLPKPLFDVVDNLGMLGGQISQAANAFSNQTVRQSFQVFLGDADKDGWVGPGESAVTTGPYILWSAGADAEGAHDGTSGNTPYGLDANGKTDDVTNFEIPIGFLKK